ncbi:hypothetical protein LXL04_028827 [Taraxacum kok-saghyz]
MQQLKRPCCYWLTGGPGCSSKLALFYENGPFKIGDNMTLTSDLIYVDQPTGTGFRYSSDNRDIRSDEQDKEFGTCVLRIIDKNYYLLARILGLPILNVMKKDGTLNEPLVSKQWFVIIEPLAEKTLDVVKKGELTIMIDRFEKVCILYIFPIINSICFF